MGQLGCLHEPPEEGIRLVDTPEAEQGAQHEGSVAHPAEAAVPFALAADHFGQRGRCRRSDRFRGGMDEELQCQGAAHDGISPLGPRSQALGPVPPHRSRRRQSALDVAPAGNHERFLVPSAQREQGPHPGGGIEVPPDRSRRQLRLTSAPRTQRHGIGTLRGHWYPGSSADAGRSSPADSAARPQTVRRGRARTLPLIRRRGGRQAQSVSPGQQAQPVDRSVQGDQGDGPPVADRRVVAKRDIAACPAG